MRGPVPTARENDGMLKFQTLTLDDLNTVRPLLGDDPDRLCDLTAGCVLLWRDYYGKQFAVCDGTLYFEAEIEGVGPVFTPPVGGDRQEDLTPLLDECRRRGLAALSLYPVSEARLPRVLAALPGAKAMTIRDGFDYLYRSEDLKYFHGKKLAGQRNHVNHFLRDNGNWHFRELTEQDAAEAGEFLDRYARDNPKDDPGFQEDMRRTRQLLTDFRRYGLSGGALWAEGRLVGLTFGEVVGDTLFIHIEKADRACPGAYQMLVSQFALHFADDGVDYINREDDTGDEGLRTSKLSYHPTALLQKYSVRFPLK